MYFNANFLLDGSAGHHQFIERPRKLKDLLSPSGQWMLCTLKLIEPSISNEQTPGKESKALEGLHSGSPGEGCE